MEEYLNNKFNLKNRVVDTFHPSNCVGLTEKMVTLGMNFNREIYLSEG